MRRFRLILPLAASGLALAAATAAFARPSHTHAASASHQGIPPMLLLLSAGVMIDPARTDLDGRRGRVAQR